MKKLLLFVLIVATIFMSVIKAYGVTTCSVKQYDNAEHLFLYDNKASYYISYIDNKAIINRIGKDSRQLTFQNKILNCHLVNGSFYFMIKNVGENMLCAKLSYSGSDIEYIKVGDFKNNKKLYFVPNADGGFYVLGAKDREHIRMYSSDGKFVKSVHIDDYVTQIETIDGKETLVLTGCNAYILKGSEIKPISDKHISFPAYILSKRYFLVKGKVYDRKYSCRPVYDATKDRVVINSYGIFRAEKDNIKFTRFSDKYVSCVYQVDEEINAIYSDEKYIYAFCGNSVKKYKFTDIVKVADNSKSDKSKEKADDNIFNGSYTKSISPCTSVEEFVKNLPQNNNAKVLFDGVNRKTGYVKTGMKITVITGNDEQSYTAVVAGDVSMDGKVTDKDVSQCLGYLSGSTKINKLSSFACDVNGDKKVDNLDLVKMSQYR